MKLINTYTGSYPIVFHAPGSARKHQVWEEMVSRIEHLKPVTITEDVEVVTWSSYTHETLLEKCCGYLGIPITVLRPKGEWNNLMKISTLVDYLPKCKAKYVIGLDADDVILTDSPDEIVRRWKQAYPQSKLLYNGGYQKWPKRYCPPCRDCDAFEDKQFYGSRAKHLNAGVWVGEREYILEFYQKVANVEREKLFHTMYRFMEQPSVRCTAFPDNYPDVMVDIDSVIFQHMLLGVTDCKYTAEYDNLPDDKKLVYYDCGAFIGKTTLNFILAHNPSKVWAFEPVAAHLETEQWRVIKAKYSDVCKVQDMACWIDDCDLEFYIDVTNAKSQSCTAIKNKETVESIDKEHPIKVAACNLNNWFLGRHRKNDYTVMKMDIEGAEYMVLPQMMASGALSKVDELRIEFHGNKMAEDYSALEQEIADYCATNNVNLLIMDH